MFMTKCFVKPSAASTFRKLVCICKDIIYPVHFVILIAGEYNKYNEIRISSLDRFSELETYRATDNREWEIAGSTADDRVA